MQPYSELVSPAVPVLDLTKISRDAAAKASLEGYGFNQLGELRTISYDGVVLNKTAALPGQIYPQPGSWTDTAMHPANVTINGFQNGLYQFVANSNVGGRKANLTLPDLTPGRHELRLTTEPYASGTYTWYGTAFAPYAPSGLQHYNLAAPFYIVEPRFWLGQAGAAPGSLVEIGGTGFAPNSGVSVLASDLCSSPPPPGCRRAPLQTIATNAAGGFTGSFTLPSATSEFFAGKPQFTGRIEVQVNDPAWLGVYPTQTLFQQQGFSFLAPGVAIPPTVSSTAIPSGATGPVTITLSTRGGFATVTLRNAAGNGNLSLTASGSQPTGAPPKGFRFLGINFDLTASNGVTFGSATVCLPYRASDLPAGGQPASLKLFHFESGAFRDVSTQASGPGNVVCGEVTSFSPFAIGGPGVGSTLFIPLNVRQLRSTW